MKILIIHNKYGKFSGEEAVVESQIQLLRKNGHVVITYFRSSEELEVISMPKLKAFFTAFYNPKSVSELKRILFTEKPDLVHVHNLYPLISPSILPIIKKMDIPIVMTVHNYRLICPNGLFFSNGEICEKCTKLSKEMNCITKNCEDSLFKSTGYALRNFWARIKKFYLNNIDSYLCLTEFQRFKLIENGFPSEKCEVLPNFYNEEIKGLNYDIAKRNYIAFAGRISPEKGILDLLEAARELRHIQFRLAGSVRENYLMELQIPENVEFVGMLNPEKLSDFYSNARFLLFTSIWYEGFPMVFPEAMAHKLPIIAPNMAAYPEIVERNKNGLLYEPRNIESLVKTIDKMWKNPLLCEKLGENGFEKVNKKYSKEFYYNQLDYNYRKVVESNKGTA